MPYCHHEKMDEPSDQDARLWRYMDVAKLVSILVDNALFFPSGRTLSGEDRFEGQPTYGEVAELKLLAERPPPNQLTTYRDEVLANFREAATAEQIQRMAIIESIAFFHCWHMNDNESDAMWKIYDVGRRGVAIRSTVGRLRNSFATFDKPIYIGKIRYFAETDDTPPDTAIYIWRFMRKKKAFEHERELRAVVIDGCQCGQAGIKVPININELICDLVISPYAESWIEPLISNLLRRLGYSFNVVRSDSDPAQQLPSASLRTESGAV